LALRSTKAGVETPATLAVLLHGLSAEEVAQQRPGSKPRQPMAGLPAVPLPAHAQQRPGSKPRQP